MRWRNSRQSRNVQDRRGRRVTGGVGLGGGGLLLLVLLVWLLGGDPGDLVSTMNGSAAPAPSSDSRSTAPRPDDEEALFSSAVLGMTEDVWGEIFAEARRTYSPPTLVLYTDMVQSACGLGRAATGPFYCPNDQNLYLDTGFFDDLARMGGPGDFARAYVIGHEVGHHVQNLLGHLGVARELQQSAPTAAEANRIQVRVELQADCYAGIWAHHANRREQVLEPGDVNEGLAAAAAIGDDRLLQRSGRAVSPESFTHGTSAQRSEWLARGLETGDPGACDTFGPIAPR